MMFEIDEFLIDTFKEEARERIINLNNLILELEAQTENEDLANEIKREAHTLKGSAKMVGFNDISELAHKMENTLIAFYDKTIDFETASQAIFKDLDDIAVKLGATDLIDRANEKKEPVQQVSDTSSEGAIHKEKVAGSLEEQINVNEAGETNTNEVSANSQQAGLANNEEGPRPGKDGVEQNEAKHDRSAGKSGETMRVSINKIDNLINLTGETIIYQIQALGDVEEAEELSRQSRRIHSLVQDVEIATSKIRSLNGEMNDIRERLEDLKDSANKLSLSSLEYYRRIKNSNSKRDFLTKELQQTALSVRMLPVSNIYALFPRAVREMAAVTGKDASLILAGGEIELDKKILEALTDPLMHLIRNSVDHGIESTSERIQKGKPSTGIIKITTVQRGDHVEISIEDDGKGIDIEKIRQTASDKGFLRSSSEPSREELMAILFKPGFSTSSIITDISGRGVGMDVVKTNIEDLKGSVQVISEMDAGTKFILKIPFTLAITRVLFVKVAGEQFALPTTSVDETLRIDPAELRSIQNKEAFEIRGRIVPITSLGFMLGLTNNVSLRRHPGKIPLVIIRKDDNFLGLAVDELIGEQEVVLKNLKEPLSDVKEISGATILGDGTVVLILDLANIFNRSSEIEILSDEEFESAGERGAQGSTILVVDDSLITRELVKSILIGCGYEVETAVDGMEAFEKVIQKNYRLVVTDINMPKLNGLDLTKKIKHEGKLRNLPIIIVSSKESPEDRIKGIEAGADAYLTKGNFDQGNLLEVVERLIG